MANRILRVVTLLMFIAIFGLFSSDNIHAQTVERWSNPATWGGTLPNSSTVVQIPEGKKVLFDVADTEVDGINIGHGGELIFEDKNFNLRTGWIMLHGKMQIGTEQSKFQSKGIITFTGTDTTENVMGMNMGTKGLMVHAGTLDLHGKVSTASWTRISQTANKGATSLTLEKNVDWKVGDKLVIASTDYNPHQAEELTITAVNGNQVQFTPALKYMHYGQDQTFGGKVAVTRAEVGLLTRNIVLQGDESSNNIGFGGHVMAMSGSTVRVEGVEFYRMGQKLGNRGILGRYPFHFHMAGETQGWYIKNSSIHHSFNRCITIHGTHNTTVNDNVCYDTIGHMYFFEDAVEYGNTLERNLGILARQPVDPLLISDVVNGFGPAIFWVSSPNNYLRGNVAAGSEGSGFWYDLPEAPLGLSANVPVVPRNEPLGEFIDNVSHSNDSFGWFTTLWNPPGDAHLVNFLGYKNRSDGMWVDGGAGPNIGRGMLIVDNAMLLDNRNGIIVPAWGVVKNSVIVGESANKGTAEAGETVGPDGRTLHNSIYPADPVHGFKFYGGPARLEDTTFVNFQSNSQRKQGAIGWRDVFFQGRDVYNRVNNLTFINANRVWFIPHPDLSESSDVGYPSIPFVDEDGSVGGVPGAIISTNFPLMISNSSISKPEWNGSVNPYHIAMMSYPCRSNCPHRIIRDDGAQMTVGFDGRFNVAVGRTYGFYRYDGQCNQEIIYRPEWQGDTIRISTPYSCSLSQIQRIRDGANFSSVNSLSELDYGDGTKYFYDQANKMLHIKLVSNATSTYTGNDETREHSESIRIFGSGTNIVPTSLTPPQPFTAGSVPTPTAVAQSKPGDANGDNKVNTLDYIVWLNNYNNTISGSNNGDFNGDNKVNTLDYIVWLNNYEGLN